MITKKAMQKELEEIAKTVKNKSKRYRAIKATKKTLELKLGIKL